MSNLSYLICLLLIGSTLSIKQVIIQARHGARVPTEYQDYEELLWKGYQLGELTEKGFNQVIKAGQHILKTYNNDLKILDEAGFCHEELFNKFESSTAERTIMSSIGYVIGLCPLNYKEMLTHLFENYFNEFSTQEEDLQAILASKFAFPYDLTQYLRNFKRKPDLLFHGHTGSNCPKVNRVMKEILNSEGHQEQVQKFKSQAEFKSILEKVIKMNPIKYEEDPHFFDPQEFDLKYLKTVLGSYKCDLVQFGKNSFRVLPHFSKEEFEFLTDLSIYYFYDVQNSDIFEHQGSLSQLFQHYIDIFRSNQRFSLISGHDSNQVAILSVLLDEEFKENNRHILLTQFASLIQFEVSEDRKVQAKLNGQILETKVCEMKSECSVDQYIQFMQQFVLQNIEEECK